MELRGRSAVITGAGSGIGRALAVRFAVEGARAVVAVDTDRAAAAATAAAVRSIGADALEVTADVAVEDEVAGFVGAAEVAFGPIDLVVSNAGIAVGGGVEVASASWQRSWEVNLMAHVYAARAALPAMLARGEGYLLNTASAAGLLTSLGAAPYAVTKHAAVALAEWLAITYGDAGIRVSCLCPQWVRTPMLESLLAGDAGGGGGERAGRGGGGGGGGGERAGRGGGRDAGGGRAGGEFVPSDVRTTPEEVADAVVAGVGDERFLILPHPEVAGYFRMRGDDHERWLRGMRRLHAEAAGPAATSEGGRGG